MIYLKPKVLSLCWMADLLLEEAHKKGIPPIFLVEAGVRRREFLAYVRTMHYVTDPLYARSVRVAREFAHHRGIDFGWGKHDGPRGALADWEQPSGFKPAVSLRTAIED